MIPGFNTNLINFNHLMFANDLILISRASWKSARNCLFCLNPYFDLTRQKPNLTKSAIYLPSWVNKHLALSISRILNVKLDTILFIYLGVPISPKKLSVSNCSSLVRKVDTIVNSWHHSTLSLAGKVVWINNSILYILIYFLSVDSLLNTNISEISKIMRKFL